MIPARGLREPDVPTDVAGAIERAGAGDGDAYAVLFHEYQPQLLRYARAHLGAAGEDVAAQVWLDVSRNLATFEGDPQAFRGWLYTIARHRIVDARRRASRRPVESVADLDGLPALVKSAEEEALEDVLADEAAGRILALLPADLAEIVLLRVIADLPVEEVARITGRRPGTVRVMQHRALRRLARELDREA